MLPLGKLRWRVPGISLYHLASYCEFAIISKVKAKEKWWQNKDAFRKKKLE